MLRPLRESGVGEYADRSAPRLCSAAAIATRPDGAPDAARRTRRHGHRGHSDTARRDRHLERAAQGPYQGPNVAARWRGVAFYLDSANRERWHGSLRAEVFDDPDGCRQRWCEVAGTVAYPPTRHVELRGELRADGADLASFSRTHRAAADPSQWSAALETLQLH